jgi:hypothetical protein
MARRARALGREIGPNVLERVKVVEPVVLQIACPAAASTGAIIPRFPGTDKSFNLSHVTNEF